MWFHMFEVFGKNQEKKTISMVDVANAVVNAQNEEKK